MERNVRNVRNVTSRVVLCCRLSELLDRPAVVTDMASSHTLDTVVVFAEDLVRKRQRPHCYVMSVDVSGRVADAGSRVKGQGPRAKGGSKVKGQKERKDMLLRWRVAHCQD